MNKNDNSNVVNDNNSNKNYKEHFCRMLLFRFLLGF